jgi:UDP-N-acetylmuramoyl-L-alanyl-D-glutamate--2,6-diaminopimelate ligase
LAAGSPSADLQVVAVTGTSGKTTVSWLVRGILEEAGQLVGMVGSIEHSVGEDLLTEQGKLWRPEADDPTAARECSAPFALAPYQGKYATRETCPNGLNLQVRVGGWVVCISSMLTSKQGYDFVVAIMPGGYHASPCLLSMLDT